MNKNYLITGIIAVIIISAIFSFVNYNSGNKEERISLSPSDGTPYKANATGSCIGKCGLSNGNCYCDSYCWMSARDCCSNFLQANCLTEAQKITWNSKYPNLTIPITNQTNQTTGSLYVTSTPANASLYVDSVYKGVTPYTVSNLTLGNHNVVLTRMGYNNYSTTKTIVAGSNILNVSLTAG